MKRGPKADLPSEKAARGTLQPCRDDFKMELISPDALPVEPEWLTPSGRNVWLDNIGRVAPNKMATEADSDQFATYCNLQGANALAWTAGEVPPIAALTEARRMAEQFGLFGRKSRLVAGAGATPSANPFQRNGRRT